MQFCAQNIYIISVIYQLACKWASKKLYLSRLNYLSIGPASCPAVDTLECHLLDASTKLRKATISFVMSVHLNENSSAPTGRIFITLDVSLFFFSKICQENSSFINPLNAELNPICYLLALLVHHFLHVSRLRVKSLTFKP